jgi:hypothetical protein
MEPSNYFHGILRALAHDGFILVWFQIIEVRRLAGKIVTQYANVLIC